MTGQNEVMGLDGRGDDERARPRVEIPGEFLAKGDGACNSMKEK